MDTIRGIDLGYIQGEDLIQYLDETYLEIAADQAVEKLERATLMAKSQVANYLAAMYDLSGEWSKTGIERNGIVLKLVITLACWEIAMGDEAMKENLKGAYKDAMRIISELQSRRQSLLNVPAVSSSISNAPDIISTKPNYLY